MTPLEHHNLSGTSGTPGGPAAHPAVASALVSALSDQVVTPAAAHWREAVQPWNSAIQQEPIAVVSPRNVAELRDILRIARDGGVSVNTQPSGHGASSDLRGTILVRPTAFDTLDIDLEKQVARIGAGVLWGTVAQALKGTGFVAAFGSNPTTSVVGYLLAGGLSLFSRVQGLAVRSLRAVELLTADGQLRWIDDSDGDLIWALRGAGGALGIVTQVELDLRPVTRIYGGQLLFPADEAAQVLDIALTESAKADEALSMMVTLAYFPDTEQVASVLRGQRLLSLDAFGFDNHTAHDRIIDNIRTASAPLIDGGFGSLDISQVHRVVNEPRTPTPVSDWSRLATVDNSTADAMVDLFLSDQGECLTTIQTRLLGGALTRPGAHPGIAGEIDDPHFVIAKGRAGDTGTAGAFSALDDLVTPHDPARTIGTFLAADQTYSDAYDSASIDRLVAVKTAVDPDGIISGNRAMR